jgi:predicted ATPase/DNA-binding winged helix-turn-helix (wHTH) protein
VSDRAIASTDHAICFGPFRLLAGQHLLLEGDRPLRLGSRALDLLTALVERRGELVSKDELIARVWPDTFVEEGNLKVHVAALRRALGDGQAGNRYVANVPGRGYCFVAPISLAESPRPSTPHAAAAVEPAHNLPPRLTRMVGRAEVVDALVDQLPRRRFITVVGPGGIGKTTVALAVATGRSASYEDGVRFVDLAPLTDPHLVPSALASVLGAAIRSENPTPGLIAFLRDKQMLLVLDSCEHVVEAAAALAVEVLKGVPGVHILATSREPLAVQGERVHRLSPLAIPPVSAGLSAAEALTFPAVQLFVERAAASLDGFELSDADAPIVADICRRLDGMALAIELAAARVDAFGVSGLAALLDDRFRLLMRGRRTELPRHQTLTAALDWSYEALPETERMILRHLAVFVGDFTLEAANAVTQAAEIAGFDVVDCIANLVAKSLVTADVDAAILHYRLLNTTRAYALEKLTASGELEQFARRHAEYYRGLFERVEAEWETRPTAEWLADYGRQIDNVRAALDWAFSPNGDTAIGVALTVAAVPLWIQFSLLDECRRRVEQALAGLGREPARSTRRHMQLFAALGVALLHKAGPGPEVRAAYAAVLEIAQTLDDTDYQLRALWGLWVCHINAGEYRSTLAFAERFCGLAAGKADPAERLIGDRMVGNALYYLGEQSKARPYIERMLRGYVAPSRRSHIVRFQFDQCVAAHMILARILWEQGFPDQAVRAAQTSVKDAQATDHALSLCISLAVGMCPVALATGDLEEAERSVALLLDHSTRHALTYWHAWSDAFKGELLIRRGEIATGLQVLGTALDESSPGTSFARHHVLFLCALAEALGRTGEIAKGLATIDAAVEQCERGEGRWCFAELLRVKGEIILQDRAADAVVAAEEHFLHSLDWARRQHTLSWELRTATSLARLRRDQRRIGEARDLLTPVHARFREGFGTADLRTAKALMDELA